MLLLGGKTVATYFVNRYSWRRNRCSQFTKLPIVCVVIATAATVNGPHCKSSTKATRRNSHSTTTRSSSKHFIDRILAPWHERHEELASRPHQGRCQSNHFVLSQPIVSSICERHHRSTAPGLQALLSAQCIRCLLAFTSQLCYQRRI